MGEIYKLVMSSHTYFTHILDREDLDVLSSEDWINLPLKVQTKYLIQFHNPWSFHHKSSYAITLIRYAKLLQLNQSDPIDTHTNAKYLQIKQSLDCVHIFKVMLSCVIKQSQLGQICFLISKKAFLQCVSYFYTPHWFFWKSG